jgi:hypothetical protein
MKLKICPDSGTVRNILAKRIDEETALLAEDNALYAKKTGTTQMIHNPYHDAEVISLRTSIDRRKSYLKDRQTELALLESHSAPKVLVEIEL